eukprot:SAG22_NODE_7106_length_775_cov_2.181953_1_plen_21_part_10
MKTDTSAPAYLGGRSRLGRGK